MNYHQLSNTGFKKNTVPTQLHLPYNLLLLVIYTFKSRQITFHFRAEQRNCEPGYILDSKNEICYNVLPNVQEKDEANSKEVGCNSQAAEVLTFENNAQAQSFVELYGMY